MFKFFRRSKTKNTTNDAVQTQNKSQSKQSKCSTQKVINTNACATTNNADLNKTSEISENVKHSHYIDDSKQVLVQGNRNNDSIQALSKRNEFKKEKSSRNEIVDQTQCQNENVSKRSISIDRKTTEQDQKPILDRDHKLRIISFNPLSKSREFINGIMAKGRNRHRNRNKQKSDNKNITNQHYHQQQKQPQEQQQKQQQQKYHNQSIQKGQQIDQQKYCEASATESCESSENIPSRKNDFPIEEKIQFGYQITKSKNSTNLVMKEIVDSDDDEDYDEDDVDDEDGKNNCNDHDHDHMKNDEDHSRNDHPNRNFGIHEIDESNDAGNDELCAGATELNLCKNRTQIQQLNDDCNYKDKYSTETNDHVEEIQQQTVTSYTNFNKNVGVVDNNDDDDDEVDSNEDDNDTDDDDDDEYDHEYHTETLPHTIKTVHDHHDHENKENFNPKNFDTVQSNDVVGQISELTECDRDRYFNIEMGQPISKTSSTSNNCQDQQNLNQSKSNNIIIPTITIADYSDPNKSNLIDNEIFYDSEETFNNDNCNKINKNLNDNNGDDNNNNDDDDEWHFLPNINDHVTIEDDLDPIYNNNVNSNSENLSTTSFSVIENQQSWYPDSGIEITSVSIDNGNDHNNINNNILLIDSTTIINDSENNLNYENNTFPRGSSTDCDDNLLQSDYEILSDPDHSDDNDQDDNCNNNNNSQHILIDSISLPDVVVESTGMGSSQSLPIKVEHFDDSSSSENTATNTVIINNDHKEKDNKRDLVNQEARFSAQLEDAQKLVLNTQAKVNILQSKIDDLEKELSAKSWNVDRLQAELDAARKEDECVRRRIKLLEDEKEVLKTKLTETEEELNQKYDELEMEYKGLQEKYKQVQDLASTLQTQLAFAQSDTEQCRKEKESLREEKDEELKKLQESLTKSYQEQKELEMKWQKEFEVLRTQNADKEEHLLMDCEWQMRTMQKSCKEKIDAAEMGKNEALQKAAEIEQKANDQIDELRHLRCCEAEVRQLRGLTNEQRQSITSMTEQLEDLKSDLESANEQIEEQIANVKKVKRQCDNALSDKDREMIQKIDEARFQVATQWEEKLLTEMTRLKMELEVVHVEDRQEALQKLQDEHLEELKALTTRYTANEQELINELESLKTEIEKKNEEFNDFKAKSDQNLLQMRLYLERADRDYQRAMNREQEKREQLHEELKKEFEQEKLEMEEKFRDRLNQVKDEFAKELANTTESLATEHRKQLEIQWEQLVAEKEEALQTMESRHRIRLEEMENRMKDLEIEHHRDMKELKNNFDVERTTLESRDLHNTHEIEQLHRKCRCLTNLFEEMRMRYERREPRPEDLHEISDLRSRCESQERDLQLLTERLRDMQIQMQEKQPNPPPRKRVVRKPPPKTIPTNCDVIYEENEERESPPLKEYGVNGDKLATTSELIENVKTES